MPDATGSAIAAAACRLVENASLRSRITRGGRAMASRYSMAHEREAYVAQLLRYLADWNGQ